MHVVACMLMHACWSMLVSSCVLVICVNACVMRACMCVSSYLFVGACMLDMCRCLSVIAILCMCACH